MFFTDERADSIPHSSRLRRGGRGLAPHAAGGHAQLAARQCVQGRAAQGAADSRRIRALGAGSGRLGCDRTRGCGSRRVSAAGMRAGLPDRLPTGTTIWHSRCRRQPMRSSRSAGPMDSIVSNAIDAQHPRGQCSCGCLPASMPQRSNGLRAATALARDLINTPANDMTPETLAQCGDRCRAPLSAAGIDRSSATPCSTERFPAIHAVGRASAVAPRLVDIEWGDASHPKVTLVGKGVCFDTGGLDIKPGASMLLMKKDMGGAAVTLGLGAGHHGCEIAGAPARDHSGSRERDRRQCLSSRRCARTRKGLSVEVGNTDAEGRLILCDALALADEERPDLLIDMATLTGAARVALGPELPALFANDDAMAAQLVQAGLAQSRSAVAHAAVDRLRRRVVEQDRRSEQCIGVGILRCDLRRAVSQALRDRSAAWMHIDLYAWNGKERPGRPVGGEAAMRARVVCVSASTLSRTLMPALPRIARIRIRARSAGRDLAFLIGINLIWGAEPHRLEDRRRAVPADFFHRAALRFARACF